MLTNIILNGGSLYGLDALVVQSILSKGQIVVVNDFLRSWAYLVDIGLTPSYLSLYAYIDDVTGKPVVSDEDFAGLHRFGVKVLISDLNSPPPHLREKYKDMFIIFDPDINRDRPDLHETSLVKLIGYFNKSDKIALFGCDGYGDNPYEQNVRAWRADAKRINEKWEDIKKEFNITVPVYNININSNITAFKRMTEYEFQHLITN